MILKFQKVNKEIPTELPCYAHPGEDAGLDLTATSKHYDDNNNVVYGTNLAVEIPLGFVGLLFPRSSNSKKDLILSNCVGVIDSGYRGEVLLKYKMTNLNNCHDYDKGDKVGQLIVFAKPDIETVFVDELSPSRRGSGGYGSTGK